MIDTDERQVGPRRVELLAMAWLGVFLWCVLALTTEGFIAWVVRMTVLVASLATIRRAVEDYFGPPPSLARTVSMAAIWAAMALPTFGLVKWMVTP